MHTNNRFWRENAQRLVEKDYKLLRKLTHILETDQNTEVSLNIWSKRILKIVLDFVRGLSRSRGVRSLLS